MSRVSIESLVLTYLSRIFDTGKCGVGMVLRTAKPRVSEPQEQIICATPNDIDGDDHARQRSTYSTVLYLAFPTITTILLLSIPT